VAVDAGAILDVLGNETRRRILKLLCEGPKYLIQLSRELNVSQQAILKHIAVLERYGFISSYEERGELPAPPRKYYVLNRAFSLTVSLAPHLAQFEARELPATLEASSRLKRLRRELHRLEALKEPGDLAGQADRLLREIDRELRELEAFRLQLLALKKAVFERLEEAGL